MTAAERARVLARYCTALDTSPTNLAETAVVNRRVVENQLQDFVNLLGRPHKPSDHRENDADPDAAERCLRGHSPGYRSNFVKAVRSWLDHNDVILRRVRIGDRDATPTIEGERVPTPEDLARILAIADLRGRWSSAYALSSA